MLYIRKRKKSIYNYRCHKTEKKFDSHRTDQRYHPTRKGLGLDLPFSRWRRCCVLNVENQWIAKVIVSKNDWKDDDRLEQDLKTYISENLKRPEVLDFMQRDFPQYTWSLPTLDRRLRHFGIFFINYDTPLAALSDAV